jgi:hypothetical protein
MSPCFRRFALSLVLLSLTALAAPPRDEHRAAAARIRTPNPRSEPAEVQPSEAAPIAAAVADAGGVDLAGLLGMITALGATFVYARGRRFSPRPMTTRRPPGFEPLDPP